MKRVLTHRRMLALCCKAVGLLLSGLAASSAWASENGPSAEQTIKIKARTFENRRDDGATMTWVVQQTVFEDGLKVMTLAGVQFEQAFGLSVVLLDDVAPQKTETTTEASQAESKNPSEKTLEDSSAEQSPSILDEPAQIHVQVRSLLVELNDLRTQPAVRQSVPSCENGRRRAVIFLRPKQLQRQLELTAGEANQWTRFGRAACARWTHIPTAPNPKNSLQIDALSLPDELAPKN